MPRERSLTLFDKLNKEQATKLQRKHYFLFFTLPLNSVGFFSEEGLTSCYKNIFIFVLCLCETQRRLKQDSSAAPSLSHPFRRSSTPPPSVPVSLVVRTGVWYWERQCSWYFLSVASQFSTESKVGGAMETSVGGGGGAQREGTRQWHQVTKWEPSRIQTALLLLSTVSWHQIGREMAVRRRWPCPKEDLKIKKTLKVHK